MQLGLEGRVLQGTRHAFPIVWEPRRDRAGTNPSFRTIAWNLASEGREVLPKVVSCANWCHIPKPPTTTKHAIRANSGHFDPVAPPSGLGNVRLNGHDNGDVEKRGTECSEACSVIARGGHGGHSEGTTDCQCEVAIALVG